MWSFLYAKKQNGKNTGMTVLIVLVVLLFFILLLSMPLLVEARVRMGLRGAVLRARVYVLGLIPIPLKLRVHFFSEPFFTLCFGKKRVSLLKPAKTGTAGIRKGVRVQDLRVSVTLGVKDDPARSTVLSGTLGVLFSMLIPLLSRDGDVRVRASKHSMIRLSASAFAVVLPVDALFGFWHARRIARTKEANNMRKSQEKRNEYASS